MTLWAFELDKPRELFLISKCFNLETHLVKSSQAIGSVVASALVPSTLVSGLFR